MPTLTASMTAPQLTQALRQLVTALSGRGSDPTGMVQGIQLRVGMAALSVVQEAFVVKGAGGVGSDNIKWLPLKPSTIAQRRSSGAERKAMGISGKRTRGLLTASQDKLWRKVFGTQKAILMAKFGMGEGEASGVAARKAWAAVKAIGAQTKLATLGGRTVQIGRDTAAMFRSLSPGVQSADQILKAEGGRVILGTRKPYAGPFHKRRPLWRTDGTLSPAMRTACGLALRRGLIEAVTQLASRGGR